MENIGDIGSLLPGIYLVHKPVGPTSFTVVQQLMSSLLERPGRRKLRMCHGGTLDPFASGLLLILVEPATKLFEYLHSVPKVYEATVRWGIETDNGDPFGKVVSTGDASGLSAERLEEALGAFVGWREQVPHATSAKRVGGERAYVRAHRGELVEMPSSRVYLHEAKWVGHGWGEARRHEGTEEPRLEAEARYAATAEPEAQETREARRHEGTEARRESSEQGEARRVESRLRMTVRGGYYVRALARDLGRMMGCGAHLTQLRRISIGPWEDPGEGNRLEVHGRDVMPWAAVRELSDSEVGELRQGRAIERGEVVKGDWELPVGFPEGEPVVRGFHLGRFVYLLKGSGEKLEEVCELGRGV